jgi:hypothetical protein
LNRERGESCAPAQRRRLQNGSYNVAIIFKSWFEGQAGREVQVSTTIKKFLREGGWDSGKGH